MRLCLALRLGSLALSYAYILDSTCTPYSDLIEAGMKSALDFAQAGSDLFSSPSTDTNILQAQNDLTTYMFASTSQNPTNKKTVTDRFTSLLKFNVNSGKPERTLNAVKDKAVYPTLTSDKLIFFCDYSRFTDNKACDGSVSNGNTCDTLMQYEGAIDNVYTFCLHPTDAEFYQAWTIPLLAWYGQNKASNIQICPWFLKQMASAQYKTVGDLGTGGALALSTSLFANKANPVAPGKTAMDTIDLFDVVLLHELGHAINTPPPTVDDPVTGGYGWTICESLSSQGNIDNADNYAYFGVGARMISPTIQGATAQRPMKDGSIQILTPATKPKRDAAGHPQPLKARDANTTSSISSFSAPSTFSTLTSARSQNYSGSISLSNTRSQSSLDSKSGSSSSTKSGLSSSSSLLRSSSSLSPGTTGATTGSQTSNSSQTVLKSSSSSATGSVSRSSSFVNTVSSSSSIGNRTSSASFSNSIPRTSTSSASHSSGSSSTTAQTGSLSFIGSFTTDPSISITPVSFTFFNVPTGTFASAAAETSEAVLVGGLFLALQANRQWLTDPKLKSQFLDNVKETQEKTTALINDLSVKPPDTPDCSNTKRKRSGAMRLSERQVRSILRDRSIIPSIGSVVEGAIHDIGTLLNCAKDVTDNLADEVNKSTPDLGVTEDLTDTLAQIGEELEDDGDDDENKSSSASASLSSSSSSSSCSARATSACDTSYLIVTPTGASTASTSTIIGSCSTTTACSASITGYKTTTTATNSGVFTVSFAGDDFAPTAWYTQQQSLISAILADTTDPRVTWSSNEVSSTANATSSSGSSGSKTVSSLTLLISTTSSGSKSATASSTTVSLSSSKSSSGTTTSSASTSTYSELPCYNYADPDHGVANICTCSNGASTPVASATGTNTGSAYQPCPWTVAPALPSTTPPPKNTIPFPFTTTLLGGQVEACETSTTSHVAGYAITLCAGSITTLVTSTTTQPVPTPIPTCTLWSDCPATYCSPKGQAGCDDDGNCRACVNDQCACVTE